MAKLTKAIVERAAKAEKGDAFVWDGELRGFGLRIFPSGLKTFLIQYRNGENRTRRVSLGQFGKLTVEQARELAKIKLGHVAMGRDPSREKAEARGAITVAKVCDWYLEEAESGRLLGRKLRPIKASTLHMDRCRIETHIKPLLGTRQVRNLRLVDIEKMQSEIAAGKTAKPRPDGRGGTTTGGPGVAGRTTSTLRSIFAHAKRNDVIEENPALGVRVLAGRRKERRLKSHEIRLLGKAARKAEQEGENAIGLASVRFLCLSGYRISEGEGLKREWLNVGEYYVQFPDTKTDGQARILSKAAGMLAQSQPAIGRNPHVFPGDGSRGQFTSTEAVLARLCRSAGLEKVTPHTLRHTFASVAGDLGYSLPVIKALLGHAAGSVTEGYIHIDEAMRAAVDRVSDHIADLLDNPEVAIPVPHCEHSRAAA